MILLDERDEKILETLYWREWRRRVSRPAWMSDSLSLVMALRLTAAYLSNPMVDLDTVALDLDVPRADIDCALEDLVPMFRDLSVYGALVARMNAAVDDNDGFRRQRLIAEQPDLADVLHARPTLLASGESN
jgi:hypothetical protein